MKIDGLILLESESIQSIFHTLNPIPDNCSTSSVHESIAKLDTEENQPIMYPSGEEVTTSGYSSDVSFSSNKDITVLGYYSSEDVTCLSHSSKSTERKVFPIANGFLVSFRESVNSSESNDFAREQFPADYTLPTTQVCFNFPPDDVFV